MSHMTSSIKTVNFASNFFYIPVIKSWNNFIPLTATRRQWHHHDHHHHHHELGTPSHPPPLLFYHYDKIITCSVSSFHATSTTPRREGSPIADLIHCAVITPLLFSPLIPTSCSLSRLLHRQCIISHDRIKWRHQQQRRQRRRFTSQFEPRTRVQDSIGGIQVRYRRDDSTALRGRESRLISRP